MTTFTDAKIAQTRTLIDQVQAVVNVMHKTECFCRSAHVGNKSCVEVESERPFTTEERKRLGLDKSHTLRAYPNYDAHRMCSSCAAYWHVSQARNDLDDLLRRYHAKRQDEMRKAVTP